MKTITFKNESGKVWVDTGEETPSQPTQQVTVGHTSPLNVKWARNIQISNEFIFVKRYGCPVVGIHVDDLVALAVAAEPGLSWPPVFIKFPQSATVKTGESATFVVEVATGELPTTYQWQTSTDSSTWNNLDGQTSPTLVATVAGQYRCVATNGAGSTSTAGAILTVQGNV
jgi:hypothetical protein